MTDVNRFIIRKIYIFYIMRKLLMVFTVFCLLSCLIPFYSVADDLEWNEFVKKEDIFQMAKEKDRYVLLFIGRDHTECVFCWQAFGWFNTTLRSIVEDNYQTWFVHKHVNDKDNDPVIYASINLYVKDYDAIRYNVDLRPPGFGVPILCIINPHDPDNDYSYIWRPSTANEREIRGFITPKSLLSGQKLKWYENLDEALKLADGQGKYLLKFVGQDASPNSHEIMKQLNESPLKEALEKNFILWFSSDVANAKLEVDTDDEDVDVDEDEDEVITQSEVLQRALPYLSILDPKEPNVMLVEEWGYLDGKTLEDIVNTFTVSNVIVPNDNKVFVSGNVLQISNHTMNEQITIYSLNGQRIASVQKNDFAISIDASAFPKGIIVIQSAAGWNTKVIVR